MEYNVYDIAELLEEAEIDPFKIRRVGKIWGCYIEDIWIGGICFRSRTGDHYRVYRTKDEIIIDESSDSNLPPLSSDYEERPTDIVEWLRFGGRLEDSYEF